MNTLRIPLSAIAGNGIAIDVTVAPEELWPQNAKELSLSAVRVAGTLMELTENAYLFTGAVSGTFHRACDRCLDEVNTPFEFPVLWNFAPGTVKSALEELRNETEDVGDTRIFPFEGNDIDLALHVWEEIVLAEPLKFLCKEDCAGLCPYCGANLNREQCSCDTGKQMENRGLAGLADILPNLRPKSSED